MIVHSGLSGDAWFLYPCCEMIWCAPDTSSDNMYSLTDRSRLSWAISENLRGVFDPPSYGENFPPNYKIFSPVSNIAKLYDDRNLRTVERCTKIKRWHRDIVTDDIKVLYIYEGVALKKNISKMHLNSYKI